MKVGDLVQVVVVHPNARHSIYRGVPGLVLEMHGLQGSTKFDVVVLAPEGEIDVWQSDELVAL
jgi:hypothetical protein